MQKAAVPRAFFLSPAPSEREIRLEPPKPKRFANEVSSKKHGNASAAAATCAGSLSLPIKNVFLIYFVQRGIEYFSRNLYNLHKQRHICPVFHAYKHALTRLFELENFNKSLTENEKQLLTKLPIFITQKLQTRRLLDLIFVCGILLFAVLCSKAIKAYRLKHAITLKG